MMPVDTICCAPRTTNTAELIVIAWIVISSEDPNHRANARSLKPAEQRSRMRWVIWGR